MVNAPGASWRAQPVGSDGRLTPGALGAGLGEALGAALGAALGTGVTVVPPHAATSALTRRAAKMARVRLMAMTSL